jgi:hypothetical protein
MVELGKCNWLGGIYFPRFSFVTEPSSKIQGFTFIVCLMKLLSLAVAPVLLLSLTGCSVEQVAQVAADAAACTALTSTLDGLSQAYQSGLVDSGVIAQIDTLVGEQARALLSTGLADDITALATTLGETDTAQGAETKVTELTASITERCSAVGVTIGE